MTADERARLRELWDEGRWLYEIRSEEKYILSQPTADLLNRLSTAVPELLAENERLRAALEHISEELPCDRPCKPISQCKSCGSVKGGICMGCIARAALAEEVKP